MSMFRKMKQKQCSVVALWGLCPACKPTRELHTSHADVDAHTRKHTHDMPVLLRHQAFGAKSWSPPPGGLRTREVLREPRGIVVNHTSPGSSEASLHFCPGSPQDPVFFYLVFSHFSQPELLLLATQPCLCTVGF